MFYCLIIRTVELNRDHGGRETNLWNEFHGAVRRFFVKRGYDARLGGCVKNRPVLGLGENSGFTLLCTWMTQFRRYCDASYGARSRESDPIYGPIVPRFFANEWKSAARDTLESPVICPGWDNLVDSFFFFHIFSLWISHASMRGLRLSSQCNYAGRARFRRKISKGGCARFREPRVNEPFTSSSFQRPTFSSRDFNATRISTSPEYQIGRSTCNALILRATFAFV